MCKNPENPESQGNCDLEQHRPMLLALARTHLGSKLRRKLDPEDLVQEVMHRAYQAYKNFQHKGDPEKTRAWLLKIMEHLIVDQLKYFNAGKRDLALELSAMLDLQQSAAGIEAFIAAEQTSPSLAAVRNEELAKLARGLEQIPEDAREVIIAKHIQNKTLQEIAATTGRTVPAVAGLLRRGLAHLREHLA